MWTTILFLLIAFIALVGLMIIHEFGHFIVAKKFGVKIEEFGIGYPPRLWAKKIGETVYSINLLFLGAFVRIRGETESLEDFRSFSSLPIYKRVLIVTGGVLVFWIVAIFLFSIVFFTGVEFPIGDAEFPYSGSKEPYIKITKVYFNSPAEISGLKAGDILKEIKTLDQTFKINKIAEFQEIIRNNQGKEISLLVKRKSEEKWIALIPRVSPSKEEGYIGIRFERMISLIKKAPWYLVFPKGCIYTLEITGKIIIGLFSLLKDYFFKKEIPPDVQFAGPVGITVFLANAVSVGFPFFIYFLAIITTTVAIFNLLPIPALDGGKLIFLLIEKIKGKPVSSKVEGRITAFFFVILIIISLFVTIKFDIPRLKDFIKWNF